MYIYQQWVILLAIDLITLSKSVKTVVNNGIVLESLVMKDRGTFN